MWSSGQGTHVLRHKAAGDRRSRRARQVAQLCKQSARLASCSIVQAIGAPGKLLNCASNRRARQVAQLCKQAARLASCSIMKAGAHMAPHGQPPRAATILLGWSTHSWPAPPTRAEVAAAWASTMLYIRDVHVHENFGFVRMDG
eukprot:354651-Chlamydomonas_euryale.AAC.2